MSTVDDVTESTGRPLPAGCIASFFGIFILAGLFLGAFAVVESLQCIQARCTWVKTPATLVRSSFYPVAVGGKGGSSYSLEVEYRYSFNGRPFMGKSVGVASTQVASSLAFEGMAEAWVADHPFGTETEAFVNPREPSEAALETALPEAVSFAYFLAVPFFAIGLIPFMSLFQWLARLFHRGFAGPLAIGWGVVALALHLAAGPVSFYVWLAFVGYFYVAGRILWSLAHPKRPR